MTEANSINAATTGIVINTGTAFTATTVTQHDVLVGGASNAITSVAPSATSGVPLISQGASSDPAFGTAVVAGGGTGVVTMTTAYAPVCAGTTATGALQVASTGLSTSGNFLISNGSSALPSFQKIPSVAFEANLSAPVTNVTGDSTQYTVIFDSVITQIGTAYNNSTGVFTAPVTGLYQFSFQFTIGGLTSSHTSGYIKIIPSTGPTIQSFFNPFAMSAGGFLGGNISFLIYLSATNTVNCAVQIIGGTKVVEVYGAAAGSTSFSGFSLGF